MTGLLRAVLVASAMVICGSVAPAASAFGPADLIAGLSQLDTKIRGKSHLAPAERQPVHDEKAALIAAGYGGSVQGVTYADVLSALDCVDLDLQLARNATPKSAAVSWADKALGCQRAFMAAVKAGGKASPAALRDLAALGSEVKAVGGRIRRGKTYGLASTAVRRSSAKIVRRHFEGKLYGVAFSEHFHDLECIDVKIEAGRVGGASSCVHRLRRLVKANN